MVGRDIDMPSAHGATAAQRRTNCFSVEGLRTRRYPQHAVSFDVGRGEILGFAGLVGAGRSEVARAIFGIEPPLAERSPSTDGARRFADRRRRFARALFLVPEDRRAAGLVVDFSIRENVSLPALGRYATHGLCRPRQERVRRQRHLRQLQSRRRRSRPRPPR